MKDHDMIHPAALIIADFCFQGVTQNKERSGAYGMELIISGLYCTSGLSLIDNSNIWYKILYTHDDDLRTYSDIMQTHVGCNVCYCGVYLISLG